MKAVALMLFVAALATGMAAAGDPAAVVADSSPAKTNPAEAVPAPVPHPHAVSPLDQRVALLARELDLDDKQQSEVRGILLRQRDEVNAIWSSAATPAATRIAASRAIGDQTAERIRAILSDKQREKYMKARPAMPSAAQSPEKLDSWINAVSAH